MMLSQADEVINTLKKNEIHTPEVIYPSDLNTIIKSADTWLNGKRIDDNIGGRENHLWRVHDSLYDLTDFINKHPGGSDFIDRTIGTDITEAFEASHIVGFTKVEAILKKYFVKKIDQPRTTNFTFMENGFYKTLKRRVEPVLKTVGTGPSTKILRLHDSLILLFFILMFITAISKSYSMAFLCGISLGMLQTLSHNFFHSKPTWRTLVWDLSMFSSRDWRITHALSHHLYSSTAYDVELAAFEPILMYPPAFRKTFIHKFIAPCYAIVLYTCIAVMDYVRRILQSTFGQVSVYPEMSFPIIELLIISFLNGEYVISFKLWVCIHLVASLWFITLPQVGTHRHPEAYHIGDKASKAFVQNKYDWGAHQLDIGYDITGKSNWFILSTTSFGDHRLHHLFPTVDHSKLPYLYPIVEKTCRDFNIPFETRSFWNMFFGHFKLLWKTTPRE